MSDDLVERVARVICCTNGQCYRPEKCFSWTFTGEARAAIAVVLEEAAKVARRSLPPLYVTDEQAIAWASASEWIEQDIRALVKEP